MLLVHLQLHFSLIILNSCNRIVQSDSAMGPPPTQPPPPVDGNPTPGPPPKNKKGNKPPPSG